MFIFQRHENGQWYIQFADGKRRSLRTRDKRIAERQLKIIERKKLSGDLSALNNNIKSTTLLSDQLKAYLAETTLGSIRFLGFIAHLLNDSPQSQRQKPRPLRIGNTIATDRSFEYSKTLSGCLSVPPVDSPGGFSNPQLPLLNRASEASVRQDR
jgi:hypothetical protein